MWGVNNQSTRELVAVIRHLDTFPEDGLVNTLENVLAFDSYDASLRNTLVEVFNKHGIPVQASLGSSKVRIQMSTSKSIPELIKTEEWKVRSKNENFFFSPPFSLPKSHSPLLFFG